MILAAAAVAGVLGALTPSHGGAVWAARLDTVGVVDFYVRPPAPKISGLDTGRFAADDLAELLPKVVQHPVKIISREALSRSEASMAWQPADVANPDRLAELARRVGALHLIIGRIDRFTISRGKPVQATFNIRLQVFDAHQKRFAIGASGEGYAVASTQRVAAGQALHIANKAALPGVLANASSVQ